MGEEEILEKQNAVSTEPRLNKRFILPEEKSVHGRLKFVRGAFNNLQKEHPEIIGMTLFGSMVTGGAKETSDIDGFIFLEESEVRKHLTEEDWQWAENKIQEWEKKKADWNNSRGVSQIDYAAIHRYKPIVQEALQTQGLTQEQIEHIRVRVISDDIIRNEIDNGLESERKYMKYNSDMVAWDKLHDELEDDKNSKVLFMFECVKCKKRQALYEDGSEWHYDLPKCPKCGSSLNHKTKSTKSIITTIYSCPKCEYKDKDVHDFKKSNEKWKQKEVRDRKLLEEYRKDFCLDDEEGPKAVMNLDNIARFVEEMKEKEKKDKNPVYQKARQLKSLKIGQLKELLEKIIEKEGYKDLAFAKPDMRQFVIVEFSVNDMKEDRKEYDSERELKRIISTILEDTNWRLMSDGISYRLGILTGRLKAYEREEDLVGLVKDKH